VNRYRIAVSENDKYFNIPLEINFDMLDREQAIQSYQEEINKTLITPIKDFDVTKFAHTEYIHPQVTLTPIQTTINNPFGGQTSITLNIPVTTNVVETSINHEFYFFDQTLPASASTITNWKVDYENAGFNDNEIYYFANNFKGSFFKLDFYNQPTTQNQQILFSIILPTQQGEKEPGFVGPPQNLRSVDVKKPKFKLDSQGADKEGFYVYWVKNRDLIDISEFYMGAKFFNAKIGQFVRMINVPQTQFPAINSNFFNKEDYFYYRCSLNYATFEYQMFKDVGGSPQRVGTINNPIKWYEYVNP
jgi:hypothetical protein